MKPSEISEIVRRLNSKKILVFGDVILDCYKYGKCVRLSPEAAVPVFEEERTEYGLGGAANVASNLVACNQIVALVSVVGDDSGAQVLCGLLKDRGIDDGLIVVDGERKTTVKTRHYTGRNTQLMRVDSEDTFAVNADVEQALLDNILRAVEDCSAVVISDYAKGAVSVRLIAEIVEAAHAKSVKVLIDPKSPPFSKYSHCDILKPNQAEFAKITGKPFCFDSAGEDCARICADFGCNSIAVTCGENGIYYYEYGGESGVIPARRSALCDVSGAGDTASAYMAAAITNGESLENAARLANFAAGLKVEKVGAVSVSTFDIIRATDKIIDESQLAALRAEYRDRRIVFTNGCFDILHAGHVDNLQTAARFGDILIIGVNSDSSVRELKGEDRPVFGLNDRLKTLAALACVDYIVAFDAPTPIEIIKAVKPNVLVKGGDYKASEVVGADFVKSLGGELKLIPLVEGLSTTGVIAAVKKQ